MHVSVRVGVPAQCHHARGNKQKWKSIPRSTDSSCPQAPDPRKQSAPEARAMLLPPMEEKDATCTVTVAVGRSKPGAVGSMPLRVAS